MTRVIRGLYAKSPPLTFRSEGRVSLLSVKIQPSLPTETLRSTLPLSLLPLNSLSTHTILSLSLLHPPAEARGRQQPRATTVTRSRAGAAHGRARAAPGREWPGRRGGILGWPGEVKEFRFGDSFHKVKSSPNSEFCSNYSFLPEVKSWVKI